MRERLREVWLPRLLFVLTSAAGLGLLLAVPLGPCLGGRDGPAVLRLFAGDAVVRRTAVASGLGLLVTACVFFRPVPPKEQKRPPDPMAGA